MKHSTEPSMQHGTVSGTRNIERGTLEHSMEHFIEHGTRSITWNLKQGT